MDPSSSTVAELIAELAHLYPRARGSALGNLVPSVRNVLRLLPAEDPERGALLKALRANDWRESDGGWFGDNASAADLLAALQASVPDATPSTDFSAAPTDLPEADYLAWITDASSSGATGGPAAQPPQADHRTPDQAQASPKEAPPEQLISLTYQGSPALELQLQLPTVTPAAAEPQRSAAVRSLLRNPRQRRILKFGDEFGLGKKNTLWIAAEGSGYALYAEVTTNLLLYETPMSFVRTKLYAEFKTHIRRASKSIHFIFPLAVARADVVLQRGAPLKDFAQKLFVRTDPKLTEFEWHDSWPLEDLKWRNHPGLQHCAMIVSMFKDDGTKETLNHTFTYVPAGDLSKTVDQAYQIAICNPAFSQQTMDQAEDAKPRPAVALCWGGEDRRIDLVGARLNAEVRRKLLLRYAAIFPGVPVVPIVLMPNSVPRCTENGIEISDLASARLVLINVTDKDVNVSVKFAGRPENIIPCAATSFKGIQPFPGEVIVSYEAEQTMAWEGKLVILP